MAVRVNRFGYPVTIRLNFSADMRSPPTCKSPQEGTLFLRRLHFQTLLAAWFHSHLREVRVLLKVYGKSDLSEIKKRIDLFQ
jgi:hypothetical protein